MGHLLWVKIKIELPLLLFNGQIPFLFSSTHYYNPINRYNRGSMEVTWEKISPCEENPIIAKIIIVVRGNTYERFYET